MTDAEDVCLEVYFPFQERITVSAAQQACRARCADHRANNRISRISSYNLLLKRSLQTERSHLTLGSLAGRRTASRRRGVTLQLYMQHCVPSTEIIMVLVGKRCRTEAIVLSGRGAKRRRTFPAARSARSWTICGRRTSSVPPGRLCAPLPSEALRAAQLARASGQLV